MIKKYVSSDWCCDACKVNFKNKKSWSQHMNFFGCGAAENILEIDDEDNKCENDTCSNCSNGYCVIVVSDCDARMGGYYV